LFPLHNGLCPRAQQPLESERSEQRLDPLLGELSGSVSLDGPKTGSVGIVASAISINANSSVANWEAEDGCEGPPVVL
jgi:hypothetical protein